MLTNLRLKNFKIWKDSGDIRLAPLTVFFGTNSAGKTSIAHLLLLLKQTAASSDTQRPLHYGDSRTLVDLGTYSDIVFGHQVEEPLEVEISWTPAVGPRITDPLTKEKFKGDSIGFHVKIDTDQRQKPRVAFFEYSLKEGKKRTLVIRMELNGGGSKYDLKVRPYKLVRHPGRAWSLPNVVSFYAFPDEAFAYFQNSAFLSRIVFQMREMLRSLYYVGPLREFPKRLYLWSGEVTDHVGERGDRVIEAILGSGNRVFNFKPSQRVRPLQELVAERLKKMKLVDDFKVIRLGEHRKEYEVLVRTHPQLPEVKLTDVGFGVSQLLPVIVDCFYVPPRSIVIFEQPEIHLHPRVQADLADLFVDAIQAREKGEPRECQFIIESHSEHFLRRLQRRIAEEKLAPNDAALYFVDTEEESARLKELEVDLYGNILNWPEDFFGDDMADVVARTDAQAKRTAREKRK